MVENFDLKSYNKEEGDDKLLEYVEQLILLYFNDIGDVKIYTDKIENDENIEIVEEGDDDEGHYIVVTAIVPDLSKIFVFKERYNTILKLKFNNEKQCYRAYWGKFHETVTALGFDPEKFWFLILFIYDYSEGACFDALTFEESPLQQLEKFIKTVDDNVIEGNGGKSLFHNDMDVTIHIKRNKRMSKIVIDQPNAIYLLAYFCEKGLEEGETIMENGEEKRMDYKNNPSLTFRALKKESEFEAYTNHIWYFAKLFIDFFNQSKLPEYRMKKKSTISFSSRQLIVKIAHFTRIATEDKKGALDTPTLNSILSQNKNREFVLSNKAYSYLG